MVSVNPLNIALSGLQVAQAQIGVTSNNVANASTPGYTRKTVEQYTAVSDRQGAGVRLGVVQRNINEILLRDYRTQTSNTAALTTRTEYLGQIQTFHGPPDSEKSISAYIGQLKDSFSELANQPESPYLVNAVYTKATQVVDKFSEYSAKLTSLRNDAQSEMTQSIQKINALSEQIAELNVSIKLAATSGLSTAALEDERDIAIKSMAEEIDISYYTSENVVYVQTRQGQAIAGTTVTPINFTATPIGPGSYYPVSAGAVKLGDPTTGVDLTSVSNLGGRLGELIKLRDETLPTYQAQADELAHSMAMRFSSQGLDLFTLPDGTIPADTPTAYVGFSADMVVNPSIASDNTLIRTGTGSASTVQDGSSEVLRKIVEYSFGSTAYLRARGTVDISDTVPTLFTTLGIAGQARLVGASSVSALTTLDSSPFINPGVEDTFTIQVGAGVAQNITITAGMTASGLVSAINAVFPGMAQLGNGGELVLNASDTLTIGAGTLGAVGLSELGLTAGATTATPPSFTIRAGNNEATTIQILSTDTSTELLSKLNAVPGIVATLTADGYLNIEPTEGGDITVVDGTSRPLAALGVTVSNVSHAAFNTTGLGPNGTLYGGVSGAATLENYSTQMISLQSQYASDATSALTAEDSYRAVIETEYLDSTGVNIDEEMARLIHIQTAYNASARTMKIAQEMLDELFNSI